MNTLRTMLPLTLLASTVAAQSLMPQPIATDRNADLVLFAGARGASVALPGATGRFELDPGSFRALPVEQRGELPINTSETRVFWQFLERDPGQQGGALSRVFVAEPGQRIGDPAQDAPSDLVDRARRFVESVKSNGMATRWQNAQVPSRAVPMHRPDVSGVAYWEFAVEPQGFVVVSVGAHDYPVAHWSDGSQPRAELVIDAAEEAGHMATAFFKLDSMAYIAEDPAGRPTGALGDQPQRIHWQQGGRYTLQPWSSWGELKQDFAEVYAPLTASVRTEAQSAWRVEAQYAGGANPENSWSSWSYRWAGSESDQRYYDQWQQNGCYIGCGPVALMMAFGWGDYRAHQNDPTWSSRKGLYRSNGSRTGSTSAVAPRYNDNGVRNAIREIASDVKTFCINGLGATYPWDMAGASDYLSGRTGARLSVYYNAAGIHEDRLRNYASSRISTHRTPCIIGTGWLNHYPLAWGYAYRSKQEWFGTVYERWFKVNQGWGGAGDTWVQAGTWFAGYIRA